MELIAKGAEAEIYLGEFLGVKAVYKRRISKRYRNPLIDRRINLERTLKEAKVMFSSIREGVRTPALYYVNLREYTLIMEYVEGLPLSKLTPSLLLDYVRDAGRMSALMHRGNIYHGDLTLNNVIASKEGAFIIDFGLSGFSNDVEDIATDIHTMLRSIESIFPSISESVKDVFLSGYKEVAGSETEDIVTRVKEIRLRGRYVEERRNKPHNVE
ncbi:Kae1-associated kinase Bud32 [Sulfolobales archaeon HS-7]|nr:Kae1-associated kinase Bud32 [Sulfolobales archaeon HS-7]